MKIGGEFEINPELLRANSSTIWDDEFLVGSGREALFEILNFLKSKFNAKHIHLPEYLCVSIYKTALKLNFQVSFFRLNENFTIDKNSFPSLKQNAVILIINYFGLCNVMNDIDWIKKNANCFVILDNVQAFFEMSQKTNADFTFTSFRKMLPIPDGGWIKSKAELSFELLSARYKSSFANFKLLASILKFYSSNMTSEDDLYLNLFKEGELMLDNSEVVEEISPYTLTILKNLNLEEIKKKRCENAYFLQSKLERFDIKQVLKYTDEHTPLFLPIVIKNRNRIREELMKNNIYLPIHWYVEENYKNLLDKGVFLADNELSLIIDQRYTIKDMEEYFNIFISVMNEYNN